MVVYTYNVIYAGHLSFLKQIESCQIRPGMFTKKLKDRLTGLLCNKNIMQLHTCRCKLLDEYIALLTVPLNIFNVLRFTTSNCSAMALVEPKEKTTKEYV